METKREKMLRKQQEKAFSNLLNALDSTQTLLLKEYLTAQHLYSMEIIKIK